MGDQGDGPLTCSPPAQLSWEASTRDSPPSPASPSVAAGLAEGILRAAFQEAGRGAARPRMDMASLHCIPLVRSVTGPTQSQVGKKGALVLDRQWQGLVVEEPVGRKPAWQPSLEQAVCIPNNQAAFL